jgi:hypothetical protein
MVMSARIKTFLLHDRELAVKGFVAQLLYTALRNLNICVVFRGRWRHKERSKIQISAVNKKVIKHCSQCYSTHNNNETESLVYTSKT